MRISILVPTLGEKPDATERLLNSLNVQTFNDFQVVIVSQDNHDDISRLITEYDHMDIVQVRLDVKGLSHARNCGIKYADGDVILLADDDCWYPENALERIKTLFEENSEAIIATQIYDPVRGESYKKYGKVCKKIDNRYALMSKSSIEISFRADRVNNSFDENFGLGATYVCCEENDFLLTAFKNGIGIRYIPEVTVYHEKKKRGRTSNQVLAKGALYKKHFGLLFSLIVLLRDLIVKRENNFSSFMEGYKGYAALMRKSG
ncbi:MAG: glycosyltransferase family 2 protein [Butyrivibrio sp.]|nr:glycosyltransferase family 2 protein [Butyrivibrio sp.]